MRLGSQLGWFGSKLIAACSFADMHYLLEVEQHDVVEPARYEAMALGFKDRTSAWR
jgi:hypothetical protein